MDSTKVGQLKGGAQAPKKDYRSPQLVCYGNVALVTGGSAGTGTDVGSSHAGPSHRPPTAG
jgi:hypothetical protein